MFSGRNVLIVGDSHVAGPPGRALEELMYELGARDVHRSGVVGEGPQEAIRTRHIAGRVALAAEGAGAPLVVFWFGGNDPPTASTAQAVFDLKRAALENGAVESEVWFVGPPSYADPALMTRADKLVAIERKIFGSRFIDSRGLVPADDPGRTPDRIHVRRGELADRWAAGIVRGMKRSGVGSSALAFAGGVGTALLAAWAIRRAL